jgi:hypothetical protein
MVWSVAQLFQQGGRDGNNYSWLLPIPRILRKGQEMTNPLARKRRLAAPQVLTDNYPSLAHTNNWARRQDPSPPRNLRDDSPSSIEKTLISDVKLWSDG